MTFLKTSTKTSTARKTYMGMGDSINYKTPLQQNHVKTTELFAFDFEKPTGVSDILPIFIITITKQLQRWNK